METTTTYSGDFMVETRPMVMNRWENATGIFEGIATKRGTTYLGDLFCLSYDILEGFSGGNHSQSVLDGKNPSDSRMT